MTMKYLDVGESQYDLANMRLAYDTYFDDSHRIMLKMIKMLEFTWYILNETVHDKTYNKTCVTSTDKDRPVHPPSMAKVLVCPTLDSTEVVEGVCDQRRL